MNSLRPATSSRSAIVKCRAEQSKGQGWPVLGWLAMPAVQNLSYTFLMFGLVELSVGLLDIAILRKSSNIVLAWMVMRRGTAGKRRGAKDKRSHTLNPVMEYLEVKKPRTFVLENVTSLRNKRHSDLGLKFTGWLVERLLVGLGDCLVDLLSAWLSDLRSIGFD